MKEVIRDTQLVTLIKLIIILFGTLVISDVFAQNAKIKIDKDRVIGDISPLLYGNFVEHLGRCVYGGIYDPGSPFRLIRSRL